VLSVLIPGTPGISGVLIEDATIDDPEILIEEVPNDAPVIFISQGVQRGFYAVPTESNGRLDQTAVEMSGDERETM
jgi:hypothetical protein